MVLTQRRYTADEYMALPLEQLHTQLIDGEIVVSDPRLRHQRISFKLLRLLADWSEDEPGRGEVGYGCNHRMDDSNVFVPDGWWFSESRIPEDALVLDDAPDLAIEVRSPSTWRYDVGTKKRTYERAGLAELWLVDTEANTVLVFRRSAPDGPEFDVALELSAGEQLTSPLLPGLAVDLAALFDR